MSEASLGPGSVVDGKYRLTAKLGEGGMGAVWRADHLTLNAPVAVKLLDPSIASTEEGKARFIREAQAAAALRGAHVVQTFDYGVFEGVPFIVMELLIGESLSERLESRGPLEPLALQSLLKQVGRAIQKAHQAGIVHRDLKPDNIFLVEGDDDEPVAKVLDFGIAKANDTLGLSSGSKTRTGALLGTPYYMSPEQAQGLLEVDYRTDLWALAIISCEALTGKRPFDSEALGDLLVKICTQPVPVPSTLGAVPPGFDEWFARAAHREAAERFASVNEMVKAFEVMLDPSKALPGAFHSLRTIAPPAIVISPSGDSLEGSEVARPMAASRPQKAVLVAAAAFLVLVIGIAMARHGSTKEQPAALAQPATAATVAPAPEKVASPAPSPESPAPAAVPSAVPDADEAERVHHAALKVSKGATKSVAVSTSAPKPAELHASAPAKPSGFDPLQMRR